MAAELNVSAITQSAAAAALQSENAASANGERAGTPTEDEPAQNDNGLGDDDDESDDENVNVVIKSNAATAPPMVGAAATNSATTGAAGTVFKGGVGQLSGIGPKVMQQKVGGVDLDTIPTVNGVMLTEMDLETLEEKPWRLPGADISDYFNYGFTEETWMLYCDRQRKLRSEAAARGVTVTNKLMAGATDFKAPQMIQTISRTDKFSEEQKNLLGLAAANLTAAVTVSSEVSTISNAITTIGSTNAAVPPNMFAKLTADPGSMLPPPFIPGMPPIPPFGLPPFPGLPGAPPVGFPGMPPGFPAFPPAAAIPNKAPTPTATGIDGDVEFIKSEPVSSPPPVDTSLGNDDEIQVTYKRKDRDREHSPRERESKKRHHRDRERSEERSGAKRSGRGRHNSEDESSTTDEKRSYKRSSKKHHKDHHRDRDHRSRSKDRTPTNDE